MTRSAIRRSPGSTRITSKTSSWLTPSRSAVLRPTRTCRQPRSPRTATSTSSTSGEWCTRSTSGRATWAASPGAWTPARRSCRCQTAVRPCGAISLFPARTIHPASSPPTKTTARSSGRRICPMGRSTCSSQPRRSPSRTKSWWARPAATAACATSSRRSMPRPASSSGANTWSRRPASPAARLGRTRTMPGKPAAARCG